MNDLLLLVRIALRNEAMGQADYEALLQWDEAQWSRVLAAARAQSITGLVSHALSLLPEGAPPLELPDALFFPLVTRADGIARTGRRLAAMADGLVARLRAAGLHPQIIKGPETARFYPVPELREYGDIDLYLPSEELPALQAAVPGGEKDPDGTYHFPEEGVDVDVHGHWLDLPYRADRLPPWPGAEATLLQLSVHILKHAVGAGVGLRQVVDLAAATQRLDYDPVKLKAIFEALHLGRWNRLISSFLARYLAIPNCMYPGDSISPQPLMDIICAGGNFGHHEASRSRALARPALRRKADTALRFLRRMPFSIRYAPRLAFSTFWTLLKGNLQRPR